MPENLEKNWEKPEEIKKEEEPATPQEHQIETFFTVLPTGEAEVHAKDSKGNLLKVEFIQPGEFTKEQIKKIESVEQAVIPEISGLDVESQGQKAAAVIKETETTAKDVLAVASKFEDFSHKILKVAPESIENPNIPLEGQHYLITQADSHLIRTELQKKGYTFEEIGDIAFRAYKDSSVLIMIYAAEKK